MALILGIWILTSFISLAHSSCTDDGLKQIGQHAIDKDTLKQKLTQHGPFVILHFPVDQIEENSCSKGLVIDSVDEQVIFRILGADEEGKIRDVTFSISLSLGVKDHEHINLEGVDMRILHFDDNLIAFATCKTGSDSVPTFSLVAVPYSKLNDDSSKKAVDDVVKRLQSLGVNLGDRLRTEHCDFQVKQ